ncbi:MAG: macro domain-containing protein [Magnetococcales bacterium]|nr:macro domain-containing protein [Magnetococcales bacterium]
MIEFTNGDILADDAEAIVNTVNCVGVMGRGIALQFKKAYPENFKAYEFACQRKEVVPGRMFIFDTHSLTTPRYIVNFPTKRHWRGNSRMEDVEAGLADLAREIQARGIRSIAIPPLGSGLGGLNWPEVRQRIVQILAGLDGVKVVVYEPTGAPDAKQMVKAKEPPKMTPGRAALVGLMHRYLGGLMDPFVSLLEVHKLMYFMQEAGQPLRLRYVKHHYGPYADNLRHVLKEVEGYFLSGYADGGDNPEKQLELVPGAMDDASRILDQDADVRSRFDRVAELVEGFETPFGMELLATVHWVTARENAQTAEDVIAKIYAWNDRKAQFSDRQIRIALEVLGRKGWLPTPIPAGLA